MFYILLIKIARMEVLFGIGVLVAIFFMAFQHSASSSGRERRQQPRNKAFSSSSSVAQVQRRIICGAAYVTDGDTITINKQQIRLFGIDAPELEHPYGKQAKWAMVKLCKGQTIQAEIIESDGHGRSVALCTLPDGRDLSAELVKQGLAIDWPKFSNGKYRHLEVAGVRRKLWLADARQRGRMDIWAKFEANRQGQSR
jgi:endonuclease YncB( thermonuclease family)